MNTNSKIETGLNKRVSLSVASSDQDMSLFEFSRWSALIRGIDIISTKAAQLKIGFDADSSLLKPLALQKYIEDEASGIIAEINCNKR